jgi:NADPH:quinone reductase-like Zn-dependent oxidoreductase
VPRHRRAAAPAHGIRDDGVIDYTAVDFAEVVSDIDVVLDTIGGDSVERSLKVLRPGGHLVTAVAEEDAGLIAKFEAAGIEPKVAEHAASCHGSFVGVMSQDIGDSSASGLW